MAQVEIAYQRPGYVLVRVHGEVDLATRPLLVEVDRIAADAAVPVVVDLCAVRFFSLAGVDWLEAAVSAFSIRGRRVRVVCPDPGPVRRLIRLLGLDGRWPLHHEVPDAVAGLDLTRVVPTSLLGPRDGRPPRRPELDSIGPRNTP
jgi:anti-anti-sigma factor